MGSEKTKELTLSDCYEGNVSENFNILFLRGFSKEITSIYFHEDESYSETSKIRTLFYVNRTYANYSDLRLSNRCFHHLLSIFLNVYFSSYSIFHFSLPKILEVYLEDPVCNILFDSNGSYFTRIIRTE